MSTKKETNAYRKDILRTIRKEKKRFFSIMVITILGVTMFSGLQAACEDLRVSGDRFYDAQNLHDLNIVSTLGLTDEDVEVLSSVDGIRQAEGVYSSTVDAEFPDAVRSVTMQTMSDEGMDVPYLTEGRLPEKADEAAVTQKLARDAGLSPGDTFTILEDTDEESSDTAETETEEASEEDSSSEDTTEGSTDDDSADDLLSDISLPDADEEETSPFLVKTFTITGIVTDVRDVNNPFGSVSYRTSSTEADTVFIRKDAVDSDVWTAVWITLDGTMEEYCYSDAYEEKVRAVREYIEDEIKEQREEARYDELRSDAEEQLQDAENTVNEKLADAREELEDGEQELEDQLSKAQQEIADGEKELEDQLSEAEEELESGEKQLSDARKQVEDGRARLDEGEKELDSQEESAKEQIAAGRAQIAAGRETLQARLQSAQEGEQEAQAQLAQIQALYGDSWPADLWNAWVSAKVNEYVPVLQAQIQGTEAQGTDPAAAQDAATAFLTALAALEDPALQAANYQVAGSLPALADALGQAQAAEQVMTAQLAYLDEQETQLDSQEESAEEQIAAGRAEIAANRKKLDDSEKEIRAQEEKLEEGRADYEQGKEEGEQKLADARKEYEEGKQEGEQKLSDGWEEYNSGKAEAEEKIADARKQIDDIEMAAWYVQDRSSLSGYSNMQSDAASIEAIARVFPVVFFVVAILVSLTTITRMVDEDRGLIGTYKSLGFTDMEIRKKYIVYTALACAAGSVVGTVMAFVALPEFIFVIFGVMYLLPSYELTFVPVYGITGPILFFGGVLLAAGLACRNELRQTPASLMRPRSPRAGSRVLLERCTPIWKRLSFLNKVTARNLFRYKKRLFMTIFGIAGCMALLLFGFAIRDSVTDLLPRQYDETTRYDAIAVANTEDDDRLLSYMEDENVADYISVMVSSVKLKTAEDEESVQLIVIPDGAELPSYIRLADTAGTELSLEDGEVFITLNAGNVMGFTDGDTVTMQLLDLQESDVPVTKLVENYLGNYVYMTKATYDTYFSGYEENGVLLHLAESCTDPVSWAKELEKKEGIISAISTQQLKDQFSGVFMLINMVVYIIIIMSAALAFTVLFTLSTTNISERIRELATIKVLGFYDREVHAYVNKETMILTVIGIVLGLPLGYGFAQTLTGILNIPSIYLAVSLHGVSYGMAAGMTFLFAVLVSLFTNRTLDAIDPAEALKSVE